MNKSAIHHADDMLVRLSTRATIWMLGTGLLGLHASIFTLSIVGMVFWNIYDSPNDLWVDEVFRRWGAVLAFHALAVAAGWTAFRLLRAEQKAISAASTSWSPAILPATTQPVQPDRWRPPTVENQRYSLPAPRSVSVAKRAFALYTTWSATIARKTMTVVASTASKWTSVRGSEPASSGEVSTSPIQSWPEGPIRLRDDEEEFIARFGGQTPAQGVGWTPSSPHQPTVDGDSEPTTPSVAKNAGQTWVEAATGGWIAPKEDEHSAEARRSNGQHSPMNGGNGADNPPNGVPHKK